MSALRAWGRGFAGGGGGGFSLRRVRGLSGGVGMAEAMPFHKHYGRVRSLSPTLSFAKDAQEKDGAPAGWLGTRSVERPSVSENSLRCRSELQADSRSLDCARSCVNARSRFARDDNAVVGTGGLGTSEDARAYIAAKPHTTLRFPESKRSVYNRRSVFWHQK